MENTKKHIIFKITNQGLFYNDTEYIKWEHTNFPDKASFGFSRRSEIFWKLEMIGFEKSTNELALEVSDYHLSDCEESFKRQTAKRPIDRLVFSNLKWTALQNLMSFYTRNLFNAISDSADFETATNAENTAEIPPNDYIIEHTHFQQPKKVAIDLKYPLIKTTFKMGYVEFEKKIKGIQNPVKIIIENAHIIPEFDYVKPFFSKVIGKKKIEVTGHVIVDELGKVSVHCRSRDIDLINEALITSVKRLRFNDAIKNPKVIAVDKSLFTPDEFFEADKELLGNTFVENDRELLNEIFGDSEIRNRKQLLYLSGKLQDHKTQLKFTLTPDFGFLFHVEGAQMNHFVWELLNTNATYIWSIEQAGLSMEKKFELLEKEINFIRDQGRQGYLRNAHISAFDFTKIIHESSKSHLKDGFPRWKMRVNEVLV